MPEVIERRFIAGRVEQRLGSTDDGRMTIGGYAAKFNRTSQNLGGFVEVYSRGFFNKSKGDGWPDVIARYNHDDMALLGTTRAGTLRLDIDTEGLRYEVDLPQSRQDIYELVQRGDITKSSTAFQVFEDDWTVSDQGYPMRSLVSGKLVDVAPVTVPAYTDTEVGLRSLAKAMEAPIEDVVRLAREDDLRSFFKRSDAAVRTTFGPHALTILQGKRD